MAQLTLEWTENDLGQTKYIQLKDLAKDPVIGLDITASTTTVSALFRAQGDTDESLWSVSCTKVLSLFGVVSFLIPASGLDQTAPGRYEMEFTVDFNGRPETVLDILKIKLRSEFPAVA